MPVAIVLPEEPDGAKNDSQPVKTWMLVVSVVLTTISAVIYVGLFISGSAFRDLFQGFGAELPALTRFVLTSYPYYGALILIGLIPCLLLLVKRSRPLAETNRLFRLVFGSFGIAFFLLSVSVVAFYLPVFEIGAVK